MCKSIIEFDCHLSDDFSEAAVNDVRLSILTSTPVFDLLRCQFCDFFVQFFGLLVSLLRFLQLLILLLFRQLTFDADCLPVRVLCVEVERLSIVTRLLDAQSHKNSDYPHACIYLFLKLTDLLARS